MEIGKVISSIAHNTYYCQVHSRGDGQQPVEPTDYAAGRFVCLVQSNGSSLVGIITNTTLYNPGLAALGPRLTQPDDLALFAPDYLAERVTLVVITLVGSIDAAGNAHQGLPMTSSISAAPVRQLNDDEFDRFHHSHSGKLALGYLPMLLATPDPVMPIILAGLIDTLVAHYPQDAARLSLLAESLAWKARIEPLA